MKKFLYPLFAVLTSVALVLGGFSFSAQQGRFCGFEVQRAEAAVPAAPLAFASVLAFFGVSVSAFSTSKGLSFADGAQQLYDSFVSYAGDSSAAVAALLALNPLNPIHWAFVGSALGNAVADWLVNASGSDVYDASGSSFSLSDGSTFNVADFSLTNGNNLFHLSGAPSDQLFRFDTSQFLMISGLDTTPPGLMPPNGSPAAYIFAAGTKIASIECTNIGSSISGRYFKIRFSEPAYYTTISRYTIASAQGGSNGNLVAVPRGLSFTLSGRTQPDGYQRLSGGVFPADTDLYFSWGQKSEYCWASAQVASIFTSSYTPSAIAPSSAATDVPSQVKDAVATGNASSIYAGVDAYSNGKVVNPSVVEYYNSYTNVISNADGSSVGSGSDYSSVLDSIASSVGAISDWVGSGVQTMVDAATATITGALDAVLEGVQTFFRPVVDFFAPLDIRDSDDIGELVISNVSKEHTFTSKFPFCLVNDYKSLYEKAISPAGGSSDYPTPGHFVVKMPAMNGLNSQPITLDMTYIFTNKYMGLTLGQISQLFVAIACLAMFLHWVGDMINVVKSPNYGYVTVEGEAVGRGR